MIDQKSVIIGFVISIVLLFSFGYIALKLGLGVVSSYGLFISVFIGATISGYLANRKNQLKVVESALHGILVGIFTGVAYILITYAITGFLESIASVLIIFALVLIGAYIILGALGGLVGMLIQVRFGKSNVQIEDLPEKDQPKQ